MPPTSAARPRLPRLVLAGTLHVQLKDMQNLRVCLDAAKTEPGHLDMLAPAARPMVTVLTGDAVKFCGKLKYSYTSKSNNWLLPPH